MSDKLIKADLGPYASQLYKYDLFNDEEYRLDTSKGLKFLHFNTIYLAHRRLTKSQFRIWQNRTVAAVALSPSGVRRLASDFLEGYPNTDTVRSLAVGVAFVSKDDNYSKKIGRDESIKKMVEVDLKVVRLIVNLTHIYVSLETHHGVDLTLRLNKKTGFSTITGQLSGSEED